MNEFIARIKDWLTGLSERERLLVTWGSVAAVVLLFFAILVLPLYSAASRAQQRVEQKQQDLSWMLSVAGELRAAGPAGAGGPESGQSLVVTVDQTARQAGLGAALRDTQPSGTGGIRVRLEGAEFDTVVGWVAQLQQQHGLAVESATVDRGAQTGIVNASIIFKKAG